MLIFLMSKIRYFNAILNFCFKSFFYCQQHVQVIEAHGYDQKGVSSKPIITILLYPWERHFMALSPACWC